MFVWTGTGAPAAGDLPTDIDDELDTATDKWAPAGLMLGDPGAEFTRDIEETDLNAWQLKRFRTVWKNGKVDGACTLYEDNEVTEDLLAADEVPKQKARYLAFEFVDAEYEHRERRITKAKASIFVENDSASEEPKGRPLRIRYYPDNTGKIFTIQKGAVAATP